MPGRGVVVNSKESQRHATESKTQPWSPLRRTPLSTAARTAYAHTVVLHARVASNCNGTPPGHGASSTGTPRNAERKRDSRTRNSERRGAVELMMAARVL